MESDKRIVALIERQELKMHEMIRESHARIGELIGQLPNTVHSYYYLSYCHSDLDSAKQKQAAILDQIEKQLHEKYEIDYYIFKQLIKRADEREEIGKLERQKHQHTDHDDNDDDLMRILSLDDE